MTSPWIPESADALEEALRQGVLTEDHHGDFKRELAPGAAANKGFAKDLAAFAVDGGRIFIGVAEHDAGPPTLEPVDLRGLKERIDQIARSAVTPPIAVRCVELPTVGAPERGCLVVVIPPSPDAPHQASERLWGRSDTTNYVLAPEQVRALHERRVTQASAIEELVEREIERDPTPPELREFGHLFVVAQPDAADEELFYRHLGEQNFSTWVHKELHPRLGPGRWSPDIRSVGTYSRRAKGWSIHDYCISEERRVRPNGETPADEAHLLDVEIQEDGGVRLFCGRATDARNGVHYFFDVGVAGLIHRVIEISETIAEAAGFLGSWRYGVALTNIHGAVSHTASQDFMASPTGYSEPSYRRTTTATYEQLSNDPITVTRKLISPLLRAVQSPP